MPGARRAKNKFGGPWTEVKLDAITEYLEFYQGALKNQGFETWYVDAFAGTGDRHAKVLTGGLLEKIPIAEEERILDGSARKALQIDPPFAHYWFAEMHRGRQQVLAGLQSEYPHDIQIYRGDANEGLRNLFGHAPWQSAPSSSRQRAVVFLDPYGMSVDFDTLAMLAETRRADVWYLFPRAAVIQQLANDHRGIDDAKRASLVRIFGCDDWEERFYTSQPSQTDFFDGSPTKEKVRRADGNEIAEFVRKRFRTIFDYVSDPLPLLVNGRDFFELYCLSNNKRVVHLIKRGVEHVLKKYTPASRRRSDH